MRDGYRIYRFDINENDSFEYPSHYLELDRLNTFHATLTPQGWVSDGSAGSVVFGPYVTLHAGYYEVDIKVRLYENISDVFGHAEVLADFGAHSFYSVDLVAQENQNQPESSTLTLPFKLYESTPNMQIHVTSSEGSVFIIESVTFWRK